jgi:hypothetical protein
MVRYSEEQENSIEESTLPVMLAVFPMRAPIMVSRVIRESNLVT